MSNINKQSSCFHKVTGVQDISHESAAACSGGAITLYDGTGFTGDAELYIGGAGFQTNNLGALSGRASSYRIQATRNRWRLFDNREFQGTGLLVGAGTSLGLLNNLPSAFNNRVVAIRDVTT